MGNPACSHFGHFQIVSPLMQKAMRYLQAGHLLIPIGMCDVQTAKNFLIGRRTQLLLCNRAIAKKLQC